MCVGWIYVGDPECGMFQVGDLVKISEHESDMSDWAIEAFESGCIFLIINKFDKWDKSFFRVIRVSDGKERCLPKDLTEKVG
jgi:hypothetical protein|tara:strand:- start:147 stop:392 length:246 start_codon:yes stop_codon:yes gene_type:complete